MVKRVMSFFVQKGEWEIGDMPYFFVFPLQKF